MCQEHPNFQVKMSSQALAPNFPSNLKAIDLENIYKKLEGAMVEIQKKQKVSSTFDELHKGAFAMVVHKQGKKLYDGMKTVVEEHIEKVRDKIVGIEYNFLEILLGAWNDHLISMKMIREILIYLDREYIVREGLLNIYDVGMYIFCDKVIKNRCISERLTRKTLKQIREARILRFIPSFIKEICRMLMDLSVEPREVYVRLFEKDFLKDSAKFYKMESEKFTVDTSLSWYLDLVEARLKEEGALASYCLDLSTFPYILSVVEEAMIKPHMKTIVDTKLMDLIRNNFTKELSLLYKLFRLFPSGRASINKVFSQCLRQEGQAVITQVSESDKFAVIENLHSLNHKYYNLVHKCFKDNKDFHQSLLEEFKFFINKIENIAERLSYFLDSQLKKFKGIERDEKGEESLLGWLRLVNVLEDKDVFLHYYKDSLAKRLLRHNLSSKRYEKAVLNHLRELCGVRLIGNLEGMLKDIATSQDLMVDFRSYLGDESQSLGVEMTMSILTDEFWPEYIVKARKPISINHLEAKLPLFTPILTYYKFYSPKNPGRKLDLLSHLSHVEMSAVFNSNIVVKEDGLKAKVGNKEERSIGKRFSEVDGELFLRDGLHKSKKIKFTEEDEVEDGLGAKGINPLEYVSNEKEHEEKEDSNIEKSKTLIFVDEGKKCVKVKESKLRKYTLCVNLHQMAILQMFNTNCEVTCKEILKETLIPIDELNNELLSLTSAPNQKILIKNPISGDCQPDDIFSVNEEFYSSKVSLKIAKTNFGELKPYKAKEKVDRDRKHHIEACIVRIMKIRKKLDHDQLVIEVTAQLSRIFVPQLKDIKERIEGLIEREFLARSDEDKKVYTYLS